MFLELCRYFWHIVKYFRFPTSVVGQSASHLFQRSGQYLGYLAAVWKHESCWNLVYNTVLTKTMLIPLLPHFKNGVRDSTLSPDLLKEAVVENISQMCLYVWFHVLEPFSGESDLLPQDKPHNWDFPSDSAASMKSSKYLFRNSRYCARSSESRASSHRTT